MGYVNITGRTIIKPDFNCCVIICDQFNRWDVSFMSAGLLYQDPERHTHVNTLFSINPALCWCGLSTHGNVRQFKFSSTWQLKELGPMWRMVDQLVKPSLLRGPLCRLQSNFLAVFLCQGRSLRIVHLLFVLLVKPFLQV